jgi:hypothetical protein
MYIYCILCDIMAESKIIRVDKEVYDKLKFGGIKYGK